MKEKIKTSEMSALSSAQLVSHLDYWADAVSFAVVQLNVMAVKLRKKYYAEEPGVMT